MTYIEDDLYREHLMDHYRNPRHKGALAAYSFRHKEHNPLCGDEVELFVKLSPRGIIEAVGFEGHGCAISQASASLLTEYIKDKTLQEARALTPSAMLELLGITPNEVRMKCALLPLQTLLQGMKNYKMSFPPALPAGLPTGQAGRRRRVRG